VTPRPLKKWVVQIRNTYDLTQVQLADLLAVTPMTVSNWESGRAEPSGWKLTILLRMNELSIPVEVLMEVRRKLKQNLTRQDGQGRMLSVLGDLFRGAP
jgi:DNA-binding XRE family transcriptional regulator